MGHLCYVLYNTAASWLGIKDDLSVELPDVPVMSLKSLTTVMFASFGIRIDHSVLVLCAVDPAR